MDEILNLIESVPEGFPSYFFLPNDINRYNTHDFLFGIEGKTNRENEALFMKVQDFIVKSGRFAS